MKNTEDIGNYIRRTRENLKITQIDLALASGTGPRFILELEKGKKTCQIGKVLKVLETLGIKVEFLGPNI